MFPLEEQIEKKCIETLRAKDSFNLSVFRMLKAAIKNEKIALGQKFSEQDIIKVLRRELKKRQDAAEAFTKGARAELAKKELAEAEIVKALLPAEMTQEAIMAIILQVIAEGNFSGSQSFGQVMKQVVAKTQGQADGGLVSRLVKDALK